LVASLPRFREAISVLKRYNVRADVLLDLGCGDGSLTIEIARVVGASVTHCVDIDVNALGVASARGLKTFVADLSRDRIPFRTTVST
jgi:predicted RNA methylase